MSSRLRDGGTSTAPRPHAHERPSPASSRDRDRLVSKESSSGRQGAHVTEMQRRRLLLATCELVAEGGLESAGVGQICKRASMSRRTFYELFEDREACLSAGFEQAISQIGQHVLPAYERELEWSDRLRAGLIALLRLFDSDPGLARLCVVESARAGATVLGRRKLLIEELANAVDAGRSASSDKLAPSPVTAQGIVGGALSVLHTRLLDHDPRPLVGLASPLMAMIVQPYLGSAAAEHELARKVSTESEPNVDLIGDPFNGLSIRFTYRTARVLATIAAEGRRGARPSNRLIGEASGILDQGQTSRLLARLQRAGLVENRGSGNSRGEANAWALTTRGIQVHEAIVGR